MSFRRSLYSVSLALLIIIGSGFWFAALATTTTSSTLSVGLTIPSSSSTPGGGGGCGSSCVSGGDLFPVISSVASSTTQTTAQVTWNASDIEGITTSSFVYGPTTLYGFSAPITGSYQVAVNGLATGTLYYFKISVTDTANQTTVFLGTWQTQTAVPPPPTPAAPPVISNVVVTVGVTTSSISWQVDKSADGQVLYGLTGAYGQQSPLDPPALTHTILLAGLSAHTTYHYQIISTDSLGDSAATNDATLTTNRAPPPPLNCSNNCANPSCASDPACRPPPPPTPEICNDKIDNDKNGLTDCADPACAHDPACKITPAPTGEICDNGLDDNGNGLVDCADPACINFSGCASQPTPTNNQTNQYVPPGSSVAGANKINLADFVFSVGGGHFFLTPVNGALTSLAGARLAISIKSASLFTSPQTFVIKIDGQAAGDLRYEPASDSYVVNINFPLSGNHQAYLEINYGSNQFDSVGFDLASLPYSLVSDDHGLVRGAAVTLFSENGTVVASDLYGYPNPVITANGGSFAWLVPNGSYYLVVKKDGYYDRQTPPFTVSNNVASQSAVLIAKPEKIVFDPNLSLTTNAANLAKNISGRAASAVRLGLQEVADLKASPAAQNTASRLVAPATVGAVAVGTLSLIPWGSLLPFLRLIFFQPILLMGRRKREGWGQVYNSLSKLPIDLVTLRLIDNQTNRLVQTKVTDKKGRYAFVALPGQFRIEAIKGGFAFPTALLQNHKEDGRRTDIYHGEIITVSEKDAVITANIPLDPAGEAVKPVRINWHRFSRAAQVALSWLGLAVTLGSLYLSPRWYVWALLGVHVVLLLVFRRLALPAKIKSWGIVYDIKTKQPVGRTVTRLFNSEFNKLVSTQITDKRGRYYFLAGDNPYYVTYEHPEYHVSKTDLIDLSGKEAENIVVDVGLTKQTEPTPPSASHGATPSPAANPPPSASPPSASPASPPPANPPPSTTPPANPPPAPPALPVPPPPSLPQPPLQPSSPTPLSSLPLPSAPRNPNATPAAPSPVATATITPANPPAPPLPPPSQPPQPSPPAAPPPPSPPPPLLSPPPPPTTPPSLNSAPEPAASINEKPGSAKAEPVAPTNSPPQP